MNAFLDQRLVDRIRSEYLEMPGMRLTPRQVERLCGIEPSVCTAILDSLVTARFLAVTPDGCYARLTEGSTRTMLPVKAKLKAIAGLISARRAS